MKQVYKNQEECCGCTACASACPHQAIKMEFDKCGFKYPVINQRLCSDCGICRKTCSFTKPNEYRRFQECFVVKHTSEDIVNESRSGGFFTAISDIILEMDGVVYGALLDDNIFVRHIRAVDKRERDSLRKSKYVQSDLDGIFSLIEKDLKNGKYVLFTGTGCQCDGLRGYLNNKKIPDEMLILCDLVCHSNASPELFRKYVEYQENRFNSKVIEYSFRDKEKYPWGSHVEKIVFENQKNFYTDEYTNLFYTDDIRPSCYRCKYTSLQRATDLTIADCWGGEKVYPEIVTYQKGASLVLINSDKGREFFQRTLKNIEVKEIDIEDVMQPRLKEPEKRSSTYNKFWDDYQHLSFDEFMKKYGHNHYSKKEELKRNIVQVIKLPIKVIRKMLRSF